MKYIDETSENDHQKRIGDLCFSEVERESKDESLNGERRRPSEESETTRNENSEDEKH